MVVKVVDITNMSESELVDLLTWASENLFNVAVEDKGEEEVTHITFFKEDLKEICCPVNGWGCPYWKENGACSMKEEEGVHPKEECDDYALFDEMFDGLDDEEE